MLFPQLSALTDVALLLLRLLLAAVFATSGWSHATKPKERAESIGMSPSFTLVLGIAELLGAASIAVGILAQLGALLLIAVMLGAIFKKIVVWKSGFWGKKNDGWYYDLLYLVGSLVIVATGGGALTLL
jgi:putative oxidoreductase